MNIFIQFDPSFEFFLQKKNKNTGKITYHLNRKASIKDIIECLGVPHTEVGGLRFNDEDIDFSYIPISPGVLKTDAVSPPFDVFSPSKLRPVPLESLKFIVDVNVIRLGRLLILSGFDVCCSSSYSDADIADIADIESRIVLTRDTGLLKRSKIIFAKRIRADLPYDQLAETVSFFGLHRSIAFFSRCSQCNCRLVSVAKEDVLHVLEPRTKAYFHTFFQCPQCKKVFWKGSHFDTIAKRLSEHGIFVD
jgi:hypothetical protein